MRIYILFNGYDEDIKGVYSSMEKLEKAREEMIKDMVIGGETDEMIQELRDSFGNLDFCLDDDYTKEKKEKVCHNTTYIIGDKK